MRKALLALAVAGSISATFGVQAQETPEGYQLEQVLIMSRHNLRAPLANNGSVLEQSTPKQWPEWEVPGGQLTTKGGVLEKALHTFDGLIKPLFAAGVTAGATLDQSEFTAALTAKVAETAHIVGRHGMKLAG